MSASVLNEYYIRLTFKVVNYYQNAGMDYLGCQMPDGAGVVSSGVSFKSPSSLIFEIQNGTNVTNKNQNLFYGVKLVSIDEKSQFKSGAALPNNNIYTIDMSLYEFSLLNSLKLAVRAGGDGGGGGNEKFFPVLIDVSSCKSGFSAKLAAFTPKKIALASGLSTPMAGDIVQYTIPQDSDRPQLTYNWGVPDVNDALGTSPGWQILGGQGTNTVTVKVGNGSGSMRVEVTDPSLPLGARTNVRTMPVTVVPNPLPVELVQFEGVAQPDGVHLRWSTATEIDNDRFEVERSIDGKNFVKIGEVKGTGNSNTLQTYFFKDGQAPAGIYYYRLNQIDFDQDQEYSKVISVKTAKAISHGALSIFPNPITQGTVTIKYPSNASISQSTLQLVDLNGRVVYSRVVDNTAGEVNLEVGQLGLRKGLYLVNLATGSHVQRLRFLIQ
ncbi:T9SS type A sorting domain-containing protein [Nibribacter ruber]|uniref:T9SS type A sorting domain-containing protein n=1 Tax=Nibribacter ruber TaxID=2698458 RepID=A0A6P1P0V6_9BACT|nr:T9SS type A sorting domain-containing protein [Nibribacter ruber]QHL87063.1 T9SS type A sorting domain-containing protein [Nibribacter ruber]